MLGEPHAGWCPIIVNDDFLGTASYLDFVPELVIKPCVQYLNSETPSGFNIEFDAEGWNFGLVEIGNRIYTYDDRGQEEPYVRIGKAVCEYNCSKDFIKNLLNEVVKDIESDFEGWVLWDAFLEQDEDYNQELLNDLLKEAKDCLKSD